MPEKTPEAPSLEPTQDTISSVAITYRNDLTQDGIGAQLHRIYGIYAISRYLNVPYLHSPIIKVFYKDAPAIARNSFSEELIGRISRIFNIHTDPQALIARSAVMTESPDVAYIRQLQVVAKTMRKAFLLRILHPHAITDRHPDIYRHVSAVSPFQRDESKVFRIALHMRRGDLIALAPDRILPNSYYVTCALSLAARLTRLGIPFECELFTQAPYDPFAVPSPDKEVECGDSGGGTVDLEANHLEDFQVIPNLTVFLDTDEIDALQHMATADALVMSHSSFSYVAAVLNKSGIVVYHPFWHSALSGWLKSETNGLLPEAELTSRLECWMRKEYA